MGRKVAQTELDAQEYETLQAAAQKSGLSIKEALRQAALRWAAEESGIDSKDPIFDIALGRRKPLSVRLKGEALKRARKASEEVDRAVYDEE
jgi:Ribbon-helix-helix protein, copG family